MRVNGAVVNDMLPLNRTLPVEVNATVPKLPTLALPDIFAVPVILAPVPVIVIVVLPTAAIVTLPLAAGILTLLFPFEIELLLTEMPVKAEPFPMKKLALKLPFASRNAIVLAVFAVSVVAPFNKLAFKFATTVFEVTTNGAVPVAILLVNIFANITLAPVKLPPDPVPATMLELVTTSTLATPFDDILTLLFAVTITLLLPFVSDDPADTVILLNNPPSPMKKLAVAALPKLALLVKIFPVTVNKLDVLSNVKLAFPLATPASLNMI